MGRKTCGDKTKDQRERQPTRATIRGSRSHHAQHPHSKRKRTGWERTELRFQIIRPKRAQEKPPPMQPVSGCAISNPVLLRHNIGAVILLKFCCLIPVWRNLLRWPRLSSQHESTSGLNYPFMEFLNFPFVETILKTPACLSGRATSY